MYQVFVFGRGVNSVQGYEEIELAAIALSTALSAEARGALLDRRGPLTKITIRDQTSPGAECREVSWDFPEGPERNPATGSAELLGEIAAALKTYAQGLLNNAYRMSGAAWRIREANEKQKEKRKCD